MEREPAAAAEPAPAGDKPDPALQSRLHNAEQENERLRDKVRDLESKLEELHSSWEKHESELGSLRTRSTSKDKEFLALKEKIAAHLKELSRAEDVSVEKIRATLEKYIGDVDESFRRAITYYK